MRAGDLIFQILAMLKYLFGRPLRVQLCGPKALPGKNDIKYGGLARGHTTLPKSSLGTAGFGLGDIKDAYRRLVRTS